MEIFAFNSRSISDLGTKFKNNEIDKLKFNNDILVNVAFNFFYFNKDKKKANKLKKEQDKIFQAHFKKETAQDAADKALINQVRQKKETIENAQAIMSEKRKELLDILLENKDIIIYSEHTYNSYIPPKDYSISLVNHLNNFKEYKKYLTESDLEINYKNPAISNVKREKIVIKYTEQPYLIDEKNDKLIQNNNNFESDKKERETQLKKLINDEEDDTLFFPEALTNAQDAKKQLNWLNDVGEDEINNNFNNLLEVRKNDKTFNNNNYFVFDSNYSMSDFEEISIFDSIPESDDRYSKFSGYISDKCFKTYMKKMNYNYIDLMLLSYFDLDKEFQIYNFMKKEEIALNFIKKIILSYGICTTKIYEHIIRTIISKKGNFNMDNYLDCFFPIFDASEKYQTLKYKFLLSLVKNHSNQTISMENYKIFCNLIKGKWIYDEDTYKKLSKNMIETFKQKYPGEYTDNFKFTHISAIVEYLVDKEYNDS